ncbi:MAG: hypothetical protein A2X28_11270 [Elusimicrobia bacterium GWA2_56_46]|nr:MAG: hypothetical protein A2X28_11270 [Elusimicrobia bacterium GWA2_56_46]OGR54517.1 MAG: hypothetical protein A2X39_10055 [Elusimicrobia bacterium GWC2_56_31]HBB68188.1 hypothetical protein [Elusimicrobiota bacterium]HBW22319.1 hypothetical protein [Elusimicrobiota bacterium]
MKKYLIAGCLAICGFNTVAALETGAEFLKIDTDARAVSMGSAYTATADGINSLSYNPAGLASIKSAEFGFSHTTWLMDSRHDFVGVGMPFGNKTRGVGSGKRGRAAVGLGVVRLSNSDMEIRNADESTGGSFSSYDQAVTLGFAMGNPEIKRWGMGAAVKYIESSIAGVKARAVAADFGLNRTLRGMPVTFGLSVQNLGTPMKYISQKDPLPLTLAGGVAVGVISGFNLAMDVKRSVYDKRTTVSVGTEYTLMSVVSLRSGLTMNRDFANKVGLGGVRGNFSAGAGLNFWGMNMDYAMQPYGELGNTQKITLRKKF